jgi:hypothetical protein
MNAALRLFRTKGILGKEEIRAISDIYKNGFHMNLQPITGGNNEVLFRTAEYRHHAGLAEKTRTARGPFGHRRKFRG